MQELVINDDQLEYLVDAIAEALAKKMKAEEPKFNNHILVPVKEAAKALGMTQQRLRVKMASGKLDIGKVITNEQFGSKGRSEYHIYPDKLYKETRYEYPPALLKRSGMADTEEEGSDEK